MNQLSEIGNGADTTGFVPAGIQPVHLRSPIPSTASFVALHIRRAVDGKTNGGSQTASGCATALRDATDGQTQKETLLPLFPRSSLCQFSVEETKTYLEQLVTACMAGESLGAHWAFLLEQEDLLRAFGERTEKKMWAQPANIDVIERGINHLRSWIAEEIGVVRSGVESEFDAKEARVAHERMIAVRDAYRARLSELEEMHTANAQKMAALVVAMAKIRREWKKTGEF